ncbi:MAG TPA: NAD(P)H-dependent oxidoreductase [Candidatus Limnocylindrales bacterium]|jgi:FMN-dependent NADH-azoreductase
MTTGSPTRLLHVIATPRGLASNTARVSSCLLEAMREQDEDLEITTLDLFRADLPSVAGKNIESKYRLMTGQSIDDDAQDSWKQIEQTIEQFMAADVYLFTVPMWNLGIPYALKYYIDAIVQPGYLFRYTPDGQVEGLVKDKTMLLVISSGSDYTTQPFASYNFVESYLRAIFGFVGLTDVHVFHANGMDMGTELKKNGQRSAIDEGRAFVRSGAWRHARGSEAVAAPRVTRARRRANDGAPAQILVA